MAPPILAISLDILPIFFIMVCIWKNLLSMVFNSVTVTPLPAAMRRRLSRRQLRCVFQLPELFRGYGQQRIRATIAAGEFNFKRAAIVSHHDRSHLPAPEHQRLTGFKMFCQYVLEQDHHVMHLNLVIHGCDPQVSPSQSFTFSSTSLSWAEFNSARLRISFTAGMV